MATKLPIDELTSAHDQAQKLHADFLADAFRDESDQAPKPDPIQVNLPATPAITAIATKQPKSRKSKNSNETTDFEEEYRTNAFERFR